MRAVRLRFGCRCLDGIQSLSLLLSARAGGREEDFSPCLETRILQCVADVSVDHCPDYFFCEQPLAIAAPSSDPYLEAGRTCNVTCVEKTTAKG